MNPIILERIKNQLKTKMTDKQIANNWGLSLQEFYELIKNDKELLEVYRERKKVICVQKKLFTKKLDRFGVKLLANCVNAKALKDKDIAFFTSNRFEFYALFINQEMDAQKFIDSINS